MDVPPRITIDSALNSPSVRALVEQEIAKLEKFYSHMTSCKVAVTATEHRHNKGGPYGVRIAIHIPRRREIVVDHAAGDRPEQEHIGVAIREAFAKARRQIQDDARIQQGVVKNHEAPLHGRISKMFPSQRYGFIETPDGFEYYFHRNSLVGGDFDALSPGTEVRFSATDGEKGPQASTVHIIGKHHIA